MLGGVSEGLDLDHHRWDTGYCIACWDLVVVFAVEAFRCLDCLGCGDQAGNNLVAEVQRRELVAVVVVAGVGVVVEIQAEEAAEVESHCPWDFEQKTEALWLSCLDPLHFVVAAHLLHPPHVTSFW